jgi:sugar phosphate isomerase/epimerase
MQFGISTHLYHDVRLDRDHLVEIAAHGFETVEIFATRTHFDYHDARALAEIEGHLADAHLRAHSIHAPTTDRRRNGEWGVAYSIATADDRARRAAVQETAESIRAAHRLAAKFVVLHLGVPSALQSDARDNRLDAAVRSVEELHAVAEPLGVRLALEVIPNQIADADDLVGLLEDRLELSGLGICLDTGHALMLGDVTDAVETVSGHLVTTHLHDNDGKNDEHRLPFDGAIDWPAVLMAFRKVGYDGVWMFELAALDAPRRVLEQAQQVRRKMEALLSA